ncbi:MAG: hypothetical protein EPO43_13550 [Rugosibacter sp.]|nr:MAG: hypothetical protein EPO43_13550 [Rugosibacter sp.]
MKTFLAVFTGSAEAMARWQALSESERQARHSAGFKAWGEWVAQHASSIVDNGSPLGRTKKVSESGIADIRNNLTAYTLVRASSHEAAANLFKGHPHFTLFPGEGVEIMECLPIPSA